MKKKLALIFTVALLVGLVPNVAKADAPVVNDIVVDTTSVATDNSVKLKTATPNAEIVYAFAKIATPTVQDDFIAKEFTEDDSSGDIVYTEVKYALDGSNWNTYSNSVNVNEGSVAGDYVICKSNTFVVYRLKIGNAYSPYQVYTYNSYIPNLSHTINGVLSSDKSSVAITISASAVLANNSTPSDFDSTAYINLINDDNDSADGLGTQYKNTVSYTATSNGLLKYTIYTQSGVSETREYEISGIVSTTGADTPAPAPIVDKTAPVIEATSTDGVSYSVSVTDNVGVAKVTLPTGDTLNTGSGTPVTGSFTVTENGDWTITAIDTAGNSSTKIITVSSLSTPSDTNIVSPNNSDTPKTPEYSKDLYRTNPSLPQTGLISFTTIIISILVTCAVITLLLVIVIKRKKKQQERGIANEKE